MKNQITFSEISKHIYTVFGEQSVLPIVFGIASIYKEHIISRNQAFPVLYLKGSFATGKTSLSSTLQAVFSNHIINIDSSVKRSDMYESIMQKGIVIIDEYNSNNNCSIVIKAVYNNAELKRAGKVNLVNVGNANSAIIINSQSLPKDETILARTILVINEKNNYSKTDALQFNNLMDVFIKNNCNCLSELISYQSIVKYSFQYSYKKSKELLLSESKNIRLIANHATILAVFECLKDLIEFPFDIEVLHEVIRKNIRENDSL